MSLPAFDNFLKPCLLFSKEPIHLDELAEKCSEYLKITDEDKLETYSFNKNIKKYYSRTKWAIKHLYRCKLLERVSKGTYQISPKGKDILDTIPEINTQYLKTIPEYFDFKKLSSDDLEEVSIVSSLNSIFENFLVDYNGPFGSDKPSYKALGEVDSWLKENITSDRPDLIVKYSLGKGNWTQVPNFSIINKNEGKDTRNGIYIVGLFQHSMEGLYLCIGQGVTGPREKFGKKGSKEYLSSNSRQVQEEVSYLKNEGFEFDEPIVLKSTGGVSLDYAEAVCLHMYLSKDDLPNDEEFKDIFDRLIKAYDKILEAGISSNLTGETQGVSSWVISPGANAKLWDEFTRESIISIGWDPLGDLSQYASKEEIVENLKDFQGEDEDTNPTNQALACFEFCHQIKKGDYVYAKQGTKKILGVGEVVSDYIFDESKPTHRNIRKVKWLKIQDYELDHKIAQKTLTDFTKYPTTIKNLEDFYFGGTNNIESSDDMFDVDTLLKDTFFDKQKFKELATVFTEKKNIIIQGAPGVGKTFIGNKLAQHIAQNNNNILNLVLHENYSYEEFIMGIRPDSDGKFVLSNGAFYNFVKKAINSPQDKFVVVLDEVNRANITKIFGELMVLVEHDKRGPDHAVKLMYNTDEDFYLPENILIIGLMNTADRSLKVIDYALRRRFHFYTFEPQFDSDDFKSFLRSRNVQSNIIEKIVTNLTKINQKISDDSFDLGPGYCIGHSFFCPKQDTNTNFDNNWYINIINSQILPLIDEYYFDKPDTAAEITNDLIS